MMKACPQGRPRNPPPHPPNPPAHTWPSPLCTAQWHVPPHKGWPKNLPGLQWQGAEDTARFVGLEERLRTHSSQAPSTQQDYWVQQGEGK